jgi:hypothetical protein
MGEVYEPRSGCRNATVEVFGDSWSLLVIEGLV